MRRFSQQRAVTAFWPGRKVLCPNEQGFVIPTQQLGTRIASLNQQEIHCSVGPVQINQTYLEDVSLLKNQRDWFPVISLDLETYVASVFVAEMPSQLHQEALKAQAVAARSYAIAHLARPATGPTTWVIQPIGRCSLGRHAPPRPVDQPRGRPVGSSSVTAVALWIPRTPRTRKSVLKLTATSAPA